MRLATAFFVLLNSTPLFGQTITVTGGQKDLAQVPISVPIAGPDRQVQLTAQSDRNQRYPGQVGGGTLYFVLDRLPAGQKLELTLSNAEPTAPVFTWRKGVQNRDDLCLGERPVLSYVHEPLDDSTRERREATFKVFHHLFAPDGSRLVTKGVGGGYTHHRGLFYGFMRTTYGDNKVVDTWHCKNDTYLSHDRLITELLGPVVGGHVVEVGWHGAGKELFAKEKRTVVAWALPHLPGTMVEFASTLAPTGPKPIKIDGDPQHAGFHFRADNEVHDKTKGQTYFVRPDGKDQPGATRNWDPKTKKGPVNLPWDAMSFVLAGKRYTALYLDHPGNPKEARGSERDYGRIGTYFVATATAAQPVSVRYRLYLTAGELTVEECEQLSQMFTSPVVTIK